MRIFRTGRFPWRQPSVAAGARSAPLAMLRRFDSHGGLSLRGNVGSAVGNLITAILLLGLIALGVWLLYGGQLMPKAPTASAPPGAPAHEKVADSAPAGEAPEPIEPAIGTP